MSKFLAALQQQEEAQVTEETQPVVEPEQAIPQTEADGNKKKKKNKNKDKKDEPAEEKKENAPDQKVDKVKDEILKPEQKAAEEMKEGGEDEVGDENDEEKTGKLPAAGGKKKPEKKKPISAAAKLAQERMQKKKEEDERQRKFEEEIKRKEEEEKKRIEEEERLKKEEEERIALERAAIKQQKINDGTYVSKGERRRREAQERARIQLLNTMQSIHYIIAGYGTNFEPNKEPQEAQESPIVENEVKVIEQKPERKQSRAEKKAEEVALKVLSGTHDVVHNKKKGSEKLEADQITSQRKKSKVSDTNENKQVEEATDDLDDWEKMVDVEQAEDAVEQLNKKQAEVMKINTQAHAPHKGKPEKHKKGAKKDFKDENQTQEEEMVEKMPEGGEDFGAEDQNQDGDVIYSSEKEAFYVKSKYRCPIICILGHVDTGKTKILDKIRKTNVQNNEEGGITQQIGASFFPQYKLKEEISKLDDVYKKIDVEIPGLLIIDTPGHESFGNLRKRGESLCDFAILVVDVKHSLENQTIESLNMLKEKGTPFIVAFNKIDIISQWKPDPNSSSYGSLKKQEGFTQGLYEQYFNRAQHDFGQHGILIQNYWENPDIENNQSIVPTSAFSGEGIPDLLGYITDYCQSVMPEKITPKEEFNCTVMEVKKIDGLGTTIDIILVDGTLREGDKIVLSGFEGTIETTIRALLTPQPLKELRVKAE